jgi:tetratricopeptide (TPR) repeat protein
MSDAAKLIQTIAMRWNAGLASAAVQQVAARVWAAAGAPGADVQALLEQIRQVLKHQLTQAASPAEQMRVMEISCLLEGAIGNRRDALSLAKNLRHLSERKGDALHQIRSAVLLGEVWYDASEVALAIEWSRRALQAAKPLVIKSQGGRPLKVLFAQEEVALAWRMALQGGADVSVDKLMADAMGRCTVLEDSQGQAGVLGTWSQVRMLQGRWAEAVEYSRQCLAMASGRGDAAGAMAALWAGARAAGRSGDLETARGWAGQAVERSRAAGDPAMLIPVLFGQASVLFLGGDEGWRAAADEAVALATAWKVEILLRWATLERSWMQMVTGQGDVEEMRSTVASFAKAGAGPLEAEARYALHHALKAAGEDAQAEYDQAREAFERLGMQWHLGKVDKREPLLNRRG